MFTDVLNKQYKIYSNLIETYYARLINSYATSTVTYLLEVIQWTDTEGEQLMRKVRIKLNKHIALLHLQTLNTRSAEDKVNTLLNSGLKKLFATAFSQVKDEFEESESNSNNIVVG